MYGLVQMTRVSKNRQPIGRTPIYINRDTSTCLSHSSAMNNAVYFEKSDLVYYEDRLKTYEHWPKQIKQSKQNLARAGFYYTGEGDKVTCFACKLSLITWEPTDDVWIEHQKWTTTCLYLKIVGHKGDTTQQIQNRSTGFQPATPACFEKLSAPNKYGFGSMSSHYFVDQPGTLFGTNYHTKPTPATDLFVKQIPLQENKPYWPCWRSETKK